MAVLRTVLLTILHTVLHGRPAHRNPIARPTGPTASVEAFEKSDISPGQVGLGFYTFERIELKVLIRSTIDRVKSPVSEPCDEQAGYNPNLGSDPLGAHYWL